MTAAVKVAAIGLPLVLVAVLAVETVLATAAEYLPADPGFVVDAVVGPLTGARGVPNPAVAAGEPVELALLGDSTVAGVGSPTQRESLAALVAQRVVDQLGRPVHVVGLGVPGARTATVRDGQVPLLRELDPDVVLIVIGSNDVTHLTAPWTLGALTTTLIEDARRAAGAPVVIGGIPQFRTVPALLQPLRWVVGRYASVLREVQRDAATAAGAPYVDIAALASPRFLGKPESMSSDGFHPSPLGYGFWADALAPVVADAATRSGPAPGGR
ncbi:MAG: SGNH/GDSL hydrolase family protein [Egibacteraceae bacterium]